MSGDDKTMRMVTNLDRPAIEAKIAEVQAAASSAGLGDLAKMFAGLAGSPRAAIEQRVSAAAKWLADKPEHRAISALVDLIEINLKNLK